ncbi:alpha,alpha-trehalase [Halorubrum xinjiangense]|uniref:Alpha,alpha-trehalase n=1 Tax=Halorubrum xinjiangense TaxID=261291 RepID=A0A1G7KAL3_9EURY|nr:trehalase family glycosidase [Halorubrum xinjiangense]SDF34081.1 alpha,alpha-trehalase [Halorubrum xinjiangense]
MSSARFDYSTFPQISGELFRAVQRRDLFDDDKRFVDAEPRVDPDLLFERYLTRRNRDDFDLESFVEEQFRLPEPVGVAPNLAASRSMKDHVSSLWGALTRAFDDADAAGSTLVPLPNPHVVPGGRFREMYYWDSYFTAEGLAADDRTDLVAGMVENIASLLDRFGFVPTGNRTYYDSRSQVPLFYRMLRVLEREEGFDAVAPHVNALRTEHEFWMDGADRVARDDGPAAHRRVVGLSDGTVLNRYWDDRARPRPESYYEDRRLADRVPVDDRPALFRDVRAACESGWDFSSRWLAGDDLTTIRTTELVPVDLNAVLFGMESALAEWLPRVGRTAAGERYADLAARRREAINRYCWDAEAEFYVDHSWTDDRRSDRLTLAAVAPLFTGVATEDRAAAVADRLRRDFLRPGGLVTTLEATGEQWDAPSGWAPLHWMAVTGLRRYGHEDLADDVASRWVDLARSSFDETGRMAEKYDVRTAEAASDLGEYELQYGFGWTNGVVTALSARR